MNEPARAVRTPPWTLGWRLRRALAWKGIDVQQMAELLEVHRTTLTRWMNDEATPKTIFLREWAYVCDVPFDWLLTGNPGPDLVGPGQEIWDPDPLRRVA